MKANLTGLAAGFIALFGAASAQADIFTYSGTTTLGNSGGLTDPTASFTTSYDDASQNLTFSMTVDEALNGGWWVVNDGPNPKGVADELAIFYFNESNLTSYVYNGLNSPNSYNDPGLLVENFGSALNWTANGDGTDTFSFAIDASGVNSYGATAGFSNWQGAMFGDTIGSWLHPVIANSYEIDGDGNLTSFHTVSSSWYDFANRTTTSTPSPVNEPAMALMLGVGFAGLVLTRRRQLAA